MKVYIAGPMTGYPLHNFPAFDAAAAALRAAGFEVSSPADNDRILGYDGVTEPAPEGLIKKVWALNFMSVVEAEVIVVLDGWRSSPGATLEVEMAQLMRKPVVTYPSMELVQPESAVEEAQRLVHGNRGASYGHPYDDFSRTGQMWGAVLRGWADSGKSDVPPELVGLCMACVKISREVNKPSRDNRVDLAGYAETVEMVMNERKAREDAVRSS